MCAPGLCSAEASVDVEHRAITYQQDRARRHFADTKFVLFERGSLSPSRSSDWGLMIAEARPFIVEAPWVAIAPGIVLCLTVIAVNLIGDGLREVLDPRLKRGRG